MGSLMRHQPASRKLIISLKQKTKIFGKNETTLVSIWCLILCPSHHLWQSSDANNPSWFLTPPKASCTKRKPKHGALPTSHQPDPPKKTLLPRGLISYFLLFFGRGRGLRLGFLLFPSSSHYVGKSLVKSRYNNYGLWQQIFKCQSQFDFIM